jgi:hypothetical protein
VEISPFKKLFGKAIGCENWTAKLLNLKREEFLSKTPLISPSIVLLACISISALTGRWAEA